MGVFELPDDIDPRVLPTQADTPGDLGDFAAYMADRQPSLGELKAASDMVATADGALMPARLAARGERGWDGADANRDSGDSAKLATLVRQMDQMADDVVNERQAYSAIRLANHWQAIRKITRDNGGN